MNNKRYSFACGVVNNSIFSHNQTKYIGNEIQPVVLTGLCRLIIHHFKRCIIKIKKYFEIGY